MCWKSSARRFLPSSDHGHGRALDGIMWWFPEIGYPQSSIFNGIFQYKSIHLGIASIYGNPPFEQLPFRRVIPRVNPGTALILCFCGPQVEETPSIELWLQIISLPPQLCGIPKKRKVFLFKTLQKSALHSLSERKMGALDFATLFMSQPGQVHESRWCQNHGKTWQKNSVLHGVILYHTVPLMYQGLSYQ